MMQHTQPATSPNRYPCRCDVCGKHMNPHGGIVVYDAKARQFVIQHKDCWSAQADRLGGH